MDIKGGGGGRKKRKEEQKEEVKNAELHSRK